MRAGVVLYCDKLYGFNFNPYVKKLTDFGGRSEPGEKNSIDVAIRECYEESLGVFSLTRSEIEQSLLISKDTNHLYIVTVDGTPYEYTKEIEKRILYEIKPETLGLIWLTLDQISIYIQEGLFFHKLVPMLNQLLI